MLYMVVSNTYTDNRKRGGRRFKHRFRRGELVERNHFNSDYTEGKHAEWFVDLRDLVLIGKI